MLQLCAGGPLLHSMQHALTGCMWSVRAMLQAIYGFRGAKSSMLQEVFKKLYGSTGRKYHLSDNYRSRPPITVVADMIRSHQ